MDSTKTVKVAMYSFLSPGSHTEYEMVAEADGYHEREGSSYARISDIVEITFVSLPVEQTVKRRQENLQLEAAQLREKLEKLNERMVHA